MQTLSKCRRWLAAAGLLALGGLMTLDSLDDQSQLLANKWKVRPSAQRNYRRFYRDYQPSYGYGMPYGGMPGAEMLPEGTFETEMPMPADDPSAPAPAPATSNGAKRETTRRAG